MKVKEAGEKGFYWKHPSHAQPLQGARSAACERGSQDVGARNFPVGTVKFRDAQFVGRPADRSHATREKIPSFRSH